MVIMEGIIMAEIMYILITETVLIITIIIKCVLIPYETIRPIIDTITIEEEHLQVRGLQQEIQVHLEEHDKVHQVQEPQILIEEVLQTPILIEEVLRTPTLIEEVLHQDQVLDKWEAVLVVWEAAALAAAVEEEEDSHSLKQ